MRRSSYAVYPLREELYSRVPFFSNGRYYILDRGSHIFRAGLEDRFGI